MRGGVIPDKTDKNLADIIISNTNIKMFGDGKRGNDIYKARESDVTSLFRATPVKSAGTQERTAEHEHRK
jgi:hypothetical protein